MTRSIIETVMGLVVLVIAAVFLIFAYNSTVFHSDGGYLLHADFNSVDGLVKGSDVRIGGVKVGSVTDLGLKKEKGDWVANVTFRIDNAYEIPVKSQIMVSSSGLLGGKYLKITAIDSSNSQGKPEYLRPGGTMINTKGVVSLEQLLSRSVFLLNKAGQSKK